MESQTVFGSFLVTLAVLQTILFLLLIRTVDLYEREPLSVIGLMALWGSVGATALSVAGNVAIGRLLPSKIDLVFGSAIWAPISEEMAKGIALVAFVIISALAQGRFGIPRFEGVTDGIVYGAAIGLGFAFTEDILFLLAGASREGLPAGLTEFFARRDFFGVALLRHALFTGAFGVSLGLATWTRRRIGKVVFPAAGLLLAMVLHSINNGLQEFTLFVRYGLDDTARFLATQTLDDSLALQMASTNKTAGIVTVALNYFFLGLFTLMAVLWLRYQREVIRTELREEISAGLISKTEWELLPSYWARSRWYFQLMSTGQWERWRILRRIHNELVGLALLKRRVKRGGGESSEVLTKRMLISKLKAQKLVFV